jgi:LmbE family N-acetylglucosaminyl deacetylase
LADLREHEVRRAVAILGLPPQRLVLLRQPDTRAPSSGPAFDTIVGRLVGFVRDFDCATILAPWQFDPHADHEAAACIASTVATVAGIRLLSYPVWGWTLPDDTPVAQETVAGWRLDVSSHQAIKRQAIMAHASQYGGLIADDPGGFRLPETLLKAVDAPWETFLLS